MIDRDLEATADDDGNYWVSRWGTDALRLPIVRLVGNVTVCEFTRLDPKLGPVAIVDMIREAVLWTFIGGAYDGEHVEFVDLDRRTWVRAPFATPAAELKWVSVDSEWPPGIAGRETVLAGAPRKQGLAVRKAVDGFRFKWFAIDASPDGTAVVTTHGKKGAVWTTDLESGKVTKLPSVGAPLMQLLWGPGGRILGLQNQVNHLHVWDGDTWSQVDAGLGHVSQVDLSPDGTRLAVTGRDGRLSVLDWDDAGDRSMSPGPAPARHPSRSGAATSGPRCGPYVGCPTVSVWS